MWMVRHIFLGLLAVLVLCVLALFTVPQLGILFLNQIETTQFNVEGDTLYMSGEINSKTLNQFETLMDQHPNVTRLVVLDVPGSIDDNSMIQLGYRVRELGLNTHLDADSQIYSGGVDLFLAGVQRTMETGAILGVHSWSDGTNQATDYPRGAPEHEQNRLYIQRMLGDDAFYWFTIEAAPAEEIHVMSDAEISRYGLLTD